MLAKATVMLALAGNYKHFKRSTLMLALRMPQQQIYNLTNDAMICFLVCDNTFKYVSTVSQRQTDLISPWEANY